MALAESNMLPIGIQAPSFELPDTVSDKTISLNDIKSDKATVVMFICNHCPYVIHINKTIIEVAKKYQAKGVSFVAISSNDAKNYPQDGPKKMKEHAAAVGYNFPYLYDESQDVAKSYDAACTPDFYLFDGNMDLVYRGRLDNSSPGNGQPLTGADLSAAIDVVLENGKVMEKQFPSMGCNIKWK